MVKICGITNLDDARAAIESGADAIGFIFDPKSPRYVEPQKAQIIIASLPSVKTIGVFVNPALDFVNEVIDKTGISTVQLHGEESPEFCQKIKKPVIKTLHIQSEDDFSLADQYDVEQFLLDSKKGMLRGGTGIKLDWDLAKLFAQKHKTILAGGLTPKNVADGVEKVQPAGVDVSSGVEVLRGKKDFSKIEKFVTNAKKALS